MAFVNYNNKEITVKIVYYGPALSGKTSCLRYIYSSRSLEKKGKLITLDTDGDRTLFFDFLPIELGKIGDYSVKVQLYTVPGQVAYDTTRKLVLQGADGIVYVADSQSIMKGQNIESFDNLIKNMKLNNLDDKTIPIIFHYNKRDLVEIMTIDELNSTLNKDNKAFFPTIATSGENVIEGLHAIMKMVIIHLKNKLSVFQKDKTVMFSKDEVTAAATPAPKKMTEGYSGSGNVGNSENIFELENPSEAETSYSEEPQDDIFSLDDADIISDVGNDNKPDSIGDPDTADMVLTDEIVDNRTISKIDPGIVKNEMNAVQVKKQISTDLNGEEITLPINISIPEDKDQIKINLNLNLVINRKK